ncbi:isopenicillin N synthase family dioxygenase [Actinoplanes solisilvae]|uniref:isopenicillin N synthase family dioxygenase n=1 Tax=Actinoplanes solisilvae TaxID=2486853 RepID=UPI000FD7CA53|nr:2OG-Fe(II) oxygenase family protein [Actinoplanes solisilvae]
MTDEFVPIIDLSGRDTETGRTTIAAEIRRACETSGFFTITGHGVSKDLVDHMYTTTKGFFTLPEEQKDRSANQGVGVSGLRRPGGPYEAFAAHVTGDLNEEQRAKLGDYPATWKAANIWPDANFKATWYDYLAAMTALSADIMRLFARALELNEDFFDRKFDEHVSLLLANYYYPDPKADELRRDAHTDWGSLTVLYVQDAAGGLQVQRDEQWLDVPSIPGSFVVNIGDLMAYWTGGRWKSTVHRVVNPAPEDTSSRISIPFFYLPNHDTSIEPMKPYAAGTGEADLDRVTVGEWFAWKMKATYQASS